MPDILAEAAETPAPPEVAWHALGNVFVFANWKGGVGKTTLAAHIASQAAEHGRRTLIVDLNGQGNIALDLGVYGRDGVDDQGRSLFLALTAGEPLTPAKDVRPNLDLLPGGQFIPRIEGHLRMEMTSQEQAVWAFLALARALAQVASDYDLIAIDSPPENELLAILALCAGRFVVAPMKTDEASRLGLRQLAVIFRKARRINPYLVLLGVALFATGTNATKVHAAIRSNVQEDLGDGVPVFTAFVRHAEALAVLARRNGLLFGELAERGKANPAFWKQLDVGDKTVVSANLARDIAALRDEIFARAKEARNNMVTAGMWP
jgi:cellulose biosynthesis protein BcsQ